MIRLLELINFNFIGLLIFWVMCYYGLVFAMNLIDKSGNKKKNSDSREKH